MAIPSSLESLPNEIFLDIVSDFDPWAIKRLSLVSKSLRSQCLPILFRHVRISFSPTGLAALRDISEVDHLRQHVVWITYEVTDILDPRACDAEQFTSELYPFRAYVEDETDHYYLKNGKMDTFPAYESVYPAFQPVAANQRIVLDKGMDAEIVPQTLCRLPKLAKFSLRYSMPAVKPVFFPMINWIGIAREDPLEHHLKVVSHGIRQARSRNILVRTMEFGGNNDRWGGACPGLLRDILEDVEILRLFRSNGVMNEICAQPSTFPRLREIDMCSFYIKQLPLFEKFLDRHAKTLRSIQCHKGNIGWENLRRIMQMLRFPQRITATKCTFHPRAIADKLFI
ncbi:hypothetical protein AJ78_08405 [Emergomyces pasteurianus Ep9510]|uniref:F-box domain-containing protein n=1 Tax=Emergomyces pasteurianus Ep9510 TaxID=1447872 RepID=A0A1J9P3A2_9EURO|nr:hypothetical protein AJ78_08405 [Emergomyces pasteurianus Ep9510]